MKEKLSFGYEANVHGILCIVTTFEVDRFSETQSMLDCIHRFQFFASVNIEFDEMFFNVKRKRDSVVYGLLSTDDIQIESASKESAARSTSRNVSVATCYCR